MAVGDDGGGAVLEKRVIIVLPLWHFIFHSPSRVERWKPYALRTVTGPQAHDGGIMIVLVRSLFRHSPVLLVRHTCEMIQII